MAETLAGSRTIDSYSFKTITPEKLNISELRGKFFHPSVPDDIIEYILQVLRYGNCGSREFISDTITDIGKTSDINKHIRSHAGYAAVLGYGIPKFDLGISWFKGKLDESLDILVSELSEKLRNHSYLETYKDGKEILLDLQQQIPRYIDFLKSISLESLRQSWNDILVQDIDFEAGTFRGQSYSFFVFLAPFIRDEDKNKLAPAYKRRKEFLEFLLNNHVINNDNQGATQIESSAVIQSRTADVIEKRLAFKDALRLLSENRNQGIEYLYERTSLIEAGLHGDEPRILLDTLNPQGSGDTKENYIAELLIKQIGFLNRDKDLRIKEEIKTYLRGLRITNFPGVQRMISVVLGRLGGGDSSGT